MKTSISTAKHTFTYDFGLTKKKVGWSLLTLERQMLEMKEMSANQKPILNGFDNLIL